MASGRKSIADLLETMNKVARAAASVGLGRSCP